jgi:hypothetical protein
MRALVLTFLLTLPLLAGCLAGPGPGVDPECAPADVVAVRDDVHFLPGRGYDLETDPRQEWDALFAATGDGRGLLFGATADGWTSTIEAIGTVNETAHVYRARLAPTEPRGSGLALEALYAWTDAGCDHTWPIRRGFLLDEPREGDLAAPGKGAFVYTAGFWENGTLFYTNMESVHNSAWPRAGWYEFTSGTPLAVYVYDRDRSERGPQWAPCAGVAPVVPPCPTGAGQPYAYSTTIRGFNEALKGLSTTTSRVVHLPPDQAYTLPGNEAHRLYGDALIFYIRVCSVTDAPVPPAAADVCPRVPA